MGESPIEVSSQPPPPPHHKLPSHNQLPISQHHRHHPRQPHRPNMSFIQIILYRCRFRDFRCSLMVGSVLGRNLKDRPVFSRKKVEECQCWSKVEVLRTGKNCPPTSSKAGFVRPMRSACPTTSDTPPASCLFHIFFPPLAAPVNLRTGIYDTALAPLVDIPISMQEKRKARRKSEDLRYQLQKQLIHGTSLKSQLLEH